jgi:hypothetical protein
LPENYEHGKFMLTMGELCAEKWEVRMFHIWYMEAAKVGLKDFLIKIPGDLFHMEHDGAIVVDFHDMHRLLRRKDLNIQQVTMFAL